MPPSQVYPPTNPSQPSTAPLENMASGASPDLSDDDSGGESPLDPVSPSGSAKSGGSASQIRVKDEAEDDSDAADATKEQSSIMPVPKRRRVTRACDECRRKKIKCDGKQPCTHCSVYSYECTYDKPSNRRRNPAPQYIEALENKLRRAEILLRKFMPDVDLTDPSLDPAVQQEFRSRDQARAQATNLRRDGVKEADNQDAQIVSMIETIGQLDLSDAGEWDFHGISSGAVFLRRMKEHFKGLLGYDYRTPFLPRLPRPRGMFKLDTPSTSGGSPWDAALPTLYDLPPKDMVKKLCFYSLNCATCLIRIVHIPSFYERLDKLFETSPESYGPDEHRFLGLLYAVMALGCMYNYSEEEGTTTNYKAAMQEGIRYYASSRLLLQDIAECRDMTSLQALLFMILFLQSTSNLSGCYSFVGIALRNALRMGLHRHVPHAQMTPIEDETRRRAFHVIRQMDIYISAVMGFPILLRDEDIDQPYPTEVDDQFITKDAILTPPPGTPSFFQAFNAHTRLMGILAKVIKYVYPLKGVEECVMNGERPNATYLISYSRIKEIERDLQEWYEQLPIAWRPGPEGPAEVLRVRTLLRFAYAHVQMMLYRPFLHYISPRLSGGKSVDERYYACAAAGISVSRNIVHIGIEIRKQAALIGPYWFRLYAQFFSILSLVFYVVENQDKPGSAEILADAEAGRDVIASMVQRSIAADRVKNTLDSLFEQLPERLKKTKPGKRPAPTKKRSAPGPKAGSGSGLGPARASVTEGGAQRQSEDINRRQSGSVGWREVPKLPHRTSSFDTSGLQENGPRGQGFVPNFPDLLPLDISTTRASSDSSGTPTTVPRPKPGFPATQTPGGGGGGTTNPLYKLDAMMFPSADPFAYPNQPLMDLASHQPGGRAQGGGGGGGGGHAAGSSNSGQHADALQFFMPNLYEDIEVQLLGPIPPYLVQAGQGHHRQAQQHQGGLDHFSGGLFGDGMLNLQHGQGGHASGGHVAGQRGQQSQQQQQGQQGEFDELQMLAGADFREDWDVLGGQGFRGL